ncbi:MAG: AlpA family transcriptional regulator [Candidatus Pacebacteria bacterium]|nr:AlpA family transcriptional regulator [Candidatus Paceibacterota bacterium]
MQTLARSIDAPSAAPAQSQQRILRRPAVEHLTGLPRSSIYAEIKKGAFPQPVKLSARAVGWLSDEIDNWLKHQIDARAFSEVKGDSKSI